MLEGALRVMYASLQVTGLQTKLPQKKKVYAIGENKGGGGAEGDGGVKEQGAGGKTGGISKEKRALVKIMEHLYFQNSIRNNFEAL